MSYAAVEWLSYLLFGAKYLAFMLALLLLLLGLDDLMIDITFWARHVWRSLTTYRRNKPADEKRLFSVPEKPLAVMVPAWNEAGVIGTMAQLAAVTLDYENYQIFVGTYPNDPATQAEVDEVCRDFPHVHKVVCARPGPTSKADCLNNIIDTILRFEQSARMEFAGFILHDSEDVISPLELRLFNYLLPAKDLIQVPVYPFAPPWREFTGGHYVDEFAEHHAKEMVIREAMLGQVPSAGVGTCFSRKAIIALLEENDGIAFDVQSLTEDYEIGMRLGNKGLKGIFARYSVRNPRYVVAREQGFGVSSRINHVICVRAHFPKHFQQAVRQKSRWIVGIVFQGLRTLGWSKRPLMNYFLWRDRRGGIANLIGVLVNITFLLIIALWLSGYLFPDSWRFLSLLGDSPLLMTLLVINGLLMVNRLLQRFYFVTRYYGIAQGLLSAPRMVWGNLINFMANLRAIRQVLREGDPRRVAWDKTTHEFPDVYQPRPKPLGRILVDSGFITASELESVLLTLRGRRLGRELLARGLLHSEQLAQALAEQAKLQWSALDPFEVPADLVASFPRKLALRCAVLPLDIEEGHLILGSERALSQVTLAAISRQINQPVRCRIVPQGRVTVGLRYWYRADPTAPLEPELAQLKARRHERAFMERVCRTQVLLGDLIQELDILPPSVFSQALFDFDPERDSLGQHLVRRGVVDPQSLELALREQQRQQTRFRQLLGVHAA